ncbi:hypothetical protein GGS24DRAFT_472104 [Hypoxylon argillaceum]|nr:hypothetical protein GGS24DRAFT_472104 [Hypoxylon argillaceum]
MFKSLAPYSASFLLGRIRAEDVKDKDMVFHTDSFYAECRAYACIQNIYPAGRPKIPYVTDCYGFLALNDAHKHYSADLGMDLCDNIKLDNEYIAVAAASPARALVKGYVEGGSILNQKTAERIRKGNFL